MFSIHLGNNPCEIILNLLKYLYGIRNAMITEVACLFDATDITKQQSSVVGYDANEMSKSNTHY